MDTLVLIGLVYNEEGHMSFFSFSEWRDEGRVVLVRREMDFWSEAFLESSLWITRTVSALVLLRFEGSALELPGFSALRLKCFRLHRFPAFP